MRLQTWQALKEWDPFSVIMLHTQPEIFLLLLLFLLFVPPPLVVLIWDQDSVTAVRDDSLASNIFRVLLEDYWAAPSCVRHNQSSQSQVFFPPSLFPSGHDWKTSSRRSPRGSNKEVWRPCQLTDGSLTHSHSLLSVSTVLYPQSVYWLCRRSVNLRLLVAQQ